MWAIPWGAPMSPTAHKGAKSRPHSLIKDLGPEMHHIWQVALQAVG